MEAVGREKNYRNTDETSPPEYTPRQAGQQWDEADTFADRENSCPREQRRFDHETEHEHGKEN